MMVRKKINIRAVIQVSALGVLALILVLVNIYNKEEPELRFIEVSDSQDFFGGGLVSYDQLGSGSYYELGSAIAIGVFSLDDEKLYSVNEEKKWPIASLTKLMTALVVSDELSRDKKVTIKKEHIEVVDDAFYGTVLEGEEYSVSDLNKAILLRSSNVAAEALADEYGREEFINLMNEYAGRLGMKDTRFIDPTGLSVRNQSTINDLHKLVSFIVKNKPEIFLVSRERFEFIYDWQGLQAREISNINQFAGRGDFIGGKTGTTPEAVGNLISVFSIPSSGGMIIIVLGSEDRFRETENLLKEWR